MLCTGGTIYFSVAIFSVLKIVFWKYNEKLLYHKLYLKCVQYLFMHYLICLIETQCYCVLYNWLLQSINDHIDNLQVASIRKSSTTMALIYMLHKWYEAMDTPGTLLRICMLDFSEAFDRIDLNILWEKLHRMRVHPVLINWIANFLTNENKEHELNTIIQDGKQ